MRFEYPEGATPISDISDLIPSWVKTQADLNQVEAENISHATSRYVVKLVSAPEKWFNVPFLQKLHREMFKDVWGWAGSFRVSETIPGVPSYRIRMDLENLCNEVLHWDKEGAELTILERAARIHHQLVMIHPFPNGNGRFSRLIADRYLKAWGHPFPRWPRDMGISGKHRKCYIESLKSADHGDLEPLIHFMMEHGAKEVALSQLLKNNSFSRSFQGDRLELLVKARVRRGYDISDLKKP